MLLIDRQREASAERDPEDVGRTEFEPLDVPRDAVGVVIERDVRPRV